MNFDDYHRRSFRERGCPSLDNVDETFNLSLFKVVGRMTFLLIFPLILVWQGMFGFWKGYQS